jgi:flagellar motor switch protein FliN/FliY
MSSNADDRIKDIMDGFQKDKVYSGESLEKMYTLTGDEEDALGEIGNISMGTAATTLNALLAKQVSITTPHVGICHSAKDFEEYQRPFVAVVVYYTEGIEGYSVFLLRKEDVILITDLLMGNEEPTDMNAEMTDLQLSAISEVMNQMIGSASTSLANILGTPVSISPPVAKRITLEEESLEKLTGEFGAMVRISFAMEIKDVLNSEIMQVLPFNTAKKLTYGLLHGVEEEPKPPVPPNKPAQSAAPKNNPKQQPESQQGAKAAQAEAVAEKNRVGVKAVQYQSFDTSPPPKAGEYEKDNINLIMDVPLQVTVELGKTKKSIKEILSFNMGSVIVLDKLAGEMVDILVNGKLFARGEVVVIDDSYGVRVTDILISPPQG